MVLETPPHHSTLIDVEIETYNWLRQKGGTLTISTHKPYRPTELSVVTVMALMGVAVSSHENDAYWDLNNYQTDGQRQKTPYDTRLIFIYFQHSG